MRFGIAAATILATFVASAAHAEDDQCAPQPGTIAIGQFGTDRILRLEDWSAKAEDTAMRVTLHLALRGDKPVRMVDGSVRFYDALGGAISSYSIDRDAHIAPSKPYKQSGLYGNDRLANLRHEEVTAKVCVRAVLYEDGTKETFK